MSLPVLGLLLSPALPGALRLAHQTPGAPARAVSVARLGSQSQYGPQLPLPETQLLGPSWRGGGRGLQAGWSGTASLPTSFKGFGTSSSCSSPSPACPHPAEGIQYSWHNCPTLCPLVPWLLPSNAQSSIPLSYPPPSSHGDLITFVITLNHSVSEKPRHPTLNHNPVATTMETRVQQ